jgi:hypothetical protein
MVHSFVLQRLVMRKAVSVCGSDESLSRVLNVPVGQMRRWIAAEDPAPLALFNRAMRMVNGAYCPTGFRGAGRARRDPRA